MTIWKGKLLISIFQYICNWLKIFEPLRTLFLEFRRVVNLEIFVDEQYLIDYAGLYINWANCEKLSFIKLTIFLMYQTIIVAKERQ